MLIESLKPDEDDEYVSINYVGPIVSEEEKLQFVASTHLDFKDFLTKNRNQEKHSHSSQDLPTHPFTEPIMHKICTMNQLTP